MDAEYFRYRIGSCWTMKLSMGNLGLIDDNEWHGLIVEVIEVINLLIYHSSKLTYLS